MKINQRDKKMMENLNNIQSLLTKVSLNNRHDRLRDWIQSAETSVSDVVQFHLRELLSNEEENK
tara:strand:- start:255 stop:446 length:192 start_codon:yes stop_codon:yes gene_type:complete